MSLLSPLPGLPSALVLPPSPLPLAATPPRHLPPATLLPAPPHRPGAGCSYLDVNFPNLFTKTPDWMRTEPGPISFASTSYAVPALQNAAAAWYATELAVAKVKPLLADQYNMVRAFPRALPPPFMTRLRGAVTVVPHFQSQDRGTPQ
jgi:hypothetical protein